VKPITFAHRGARSERPENTLAAFERALELGATGLESDAHLSSDGQVVLVHDPLVRAGLRRRRVAQTTAADLAGLGIPRLADLYDAVGTDFELSIDLKAEGVANPLLAVARGVGADDRLWICAGRLATLEAIREPGAAHLVHSTKRAAIDSSVERHADHLARIGVGVCNMRHTDWTAGLVGLFHRFDVLAFAWGAQEVRHVRAMLDVGIDGVYSDHVDRLVATVAEWSET